MSQEVTEWLQQVVELRRAAREQPPNEGEWMEPVTVEAGGDIE